MKIEEIRMHKRAAERNKMKEDLWEDHEQDKRFNRICRKRDWRLLEEEECVEKPSEIEEIVPFQFKKISI